MVHKGDTARFLRGGGDGGDTFCFINTRDVKTLIEIMKYLPKIDKIFQKDTIQSTNSL